MSLSNQNGRALEYIIVEKILRENPHSSITDRAKVDQERDISKFNSLPDDLKNNFRLASQRIYSWLVNHYSLDRNTFILDRLPDSDAQQSNPTDISIDINNQTINLSIKHNHYATKHQRPASLAQHVGIIKGDTEDIEYRRRHKRICNEFYNHVKSINNDFKKFNEVKEYSNELIDRSLYKPVCEDVIMFLSNSKNNTERVLHFFKFLVGDRDFYKFIIKDQSTYLMDFSAIKSPTSFDISLLDSSHIEIEFNNNWIFNMRLHTASSQMSGCNKNGCSLKFDTKLSNDPLVEIEI